MAQMGSGILGKSLPGMGVFERGKRAGMGVYKGTKDKAHEAEAKIKKMTGKARAKWYPTPQEFYPPILLP